MAAAQDVENQKILSNSLGPPVSQNAGRGITESQGSPSGLRVQVAVLRADNIPRIKNLFGLRFFATVTSQATEKKTSSVPTKGTAVQWNQILDTFIVQPSSRLVLRLYAERFARRDILVGTYEMIPVESQTDVPFVLTKGDRQVGQLVQPVTLYLTVIVSPNITSYPILPMDASNPQSTELDKSPLREATSYTAKDSTGTTRSTVATGSETLSPPTDHLPSTSIPPATDRRAGMTENALRETDEFVTTTTFTTRSTFATESESISPSTNRPPSEMSALTPPAADQKAGMSPAEIALRDAKKSMAAINLSKTWEGSLERIKWVMDTLSPVAGLHPYAQMAYSLLFAIPKTLLEQFQRDDNVRTLLIAVHDAFDFTNQEGTFKTIERVPRQAQIVTLMLQHVCNCCDFIQSYAKDSEFWKRVLRNTTSSEGDKKVEDFRTTLLELHKSFLDEGAITTEITALQILDDVGIISANVGIISASVGLLSANVGANFGKISSHLDGMATQLKWMSSQALDVELDAKIREIPYGTGSRFTPDKGCLTGTRTAFMDFIIKWVNRPASERCLVLFGQAGTGKSSIAHEIARRFDNMHRLTSSFIFLRNEKSKPSSGKTSRVKQALARDNFVRLTINYC